MDILEELKSDRERGARRLVTVYGDRLFGVARRLGLNVQDAEDLVSRTLARALERADSFNARSSFYTWLYAIMMNFRRMDLRSCADHALVYTDELPEVMDERPGPGEALSAAADGEALRRAVDGLPPLFRDVVVYRYYEDLSIAEIAVVLGIPEGTVRFRLHHAKSLVRRELVKIAGSGSETKKEWGGNELS